MPKNRLKPVYKDSDFDDSDSDDSESTGPTKKSKSGLLTETSSNGNEGLSPDANVTLQKVLTEMEVILGYVRKMRDEQKKQSNAIRKLKRDVTLIKGKLTKTKAIEKEWPIMTMEKLTEVENKIVTDTGYSLQLKEVFKKFEGGLKRLFSRELLSGFSLKGRGGLVAFRDSPMMSLIATAFTEASDNKSYQEVLSEMDKTINKVRGSMASQASKSKRKQMEAVQEPSDQSEEDEPAIKIEQVMVGEYQYE